MTLKELAAQYRESATLLEKRIKQLKRTSTKKLCKMEQYRMRARINALSRMMRYANDTAYYLETYYDV